MFYIAVPLIVFFCRKWRRDAVLWTLFIASVLFHIALAGHKSLVVQLPGQLCFFLVGTLIHYHLPFFKKHGKLLMLGALAAHALHLYTGWFFLRPLSVASSHPRRLPSSPPHPGPHPLGRLLLRHLHPPLPHRAVHHRRRPLHHPPLDSPRPHDPHRRLRRSVLLVSR